jgi:hypothetical protein
MKIFYMKDWKIHPRTGTFFRVGNRIWYALGRLGRFVVAGDPSELGGMILFVIVIVVLIILGLCM